MKLRYFWILIAILAFTGCDDTTGSTGIGLLPGEDSKDLRSATYTVQTRSITIDSVYAKTSTGYLGKFTDPEFGYLDASFLTQFYCETEQFLPDLYNPNKLDTINPSMAGDSLNYVHLMLYYSDFFGDPQAASHLSVYRLNTELEKYPYTDIEPEKYYNPNDPDALLGTRAYTAVNPSGNETSEDQKMAWLTIPLKKEFGEEILTTYREHPEYFANSKEFIKEVLQGVYVKNDYGDGTIIYFDYMELYFGLNIHHKDSLGKKLIRQDGTDSIYTASISMASTREVVQANQILNSDKIKEKSEETEWTYLKTPAGIFTEVTLPLKEIDEKHENDTISGVRLVFTHYYEKSELEYSMPPPDTLLLVRKYNDEHIKFFEENKVADNRTSYTVSRNSSTNQYTFSNIATLVSTCLAEKHDEKEKAREKAGSSWNESAWEDEWEKENPDWDKLILIPIKQLNTSQTVVGVYHDLRPRYVKLKGGDPEEGGNLLELSINYINFSKPDKK